MAKTKGGLFSVHAHGTIGGLLTYQGRKQFEHVHRKPTPKDPKTSGQTTGRINFADVVAMWHRISDADKAIYNSLGYKYGNIPGFNVFIKLNIGNINYWAMFGEGLYGEHYKFGGPISTQVT